MKIFFATLKALSMNPMIPSRCSLREVHMTKCGYLLSRSDPSVSRGFSLIEIVVFMVVASVIIGGILLPFVMGVKEFEKPDEILWAAHLAQSVMEKYSHVAFSDSYLNITPISGMAVTDIAFPDGYSGTKSIQYVDTNLYISAEETPYKKIEIVITTPSSRTVSLQGIVSNWSVIP